jgi:hypothetical protein
LYRQQKTKLLEPALYFCSHSPRATANAVSEKSALVT